jgi:hypothetical protein
VSKVSKNILFILYKLAMKKERDNKKNISMSDDNFNSMHSKDNIDPNWVRKKTHSQKLFLTTKVFWKDAVFNLEHTSEAMLIGQDWNPHRKDSQEEGKRSPGKMGHKRKWSFKSCKRGRRSQTTHSTDISIKKLAQIAALDAMATIPDSVVSRHSKQRFGTECMAECKTARALFVHPAVPSPPPVAASTVGSPASSVPASLNQNDVPAEQEDEVSMASSAVSEASGLGRSKHTPQNDKKDNTGSNKAIAMTMTKIIVMATAAKVTGMIQS